MNNRVSGWRVAAVVMATALTAAPAVAQYQMGDIFASIGSGQVAEYRADGTLVRTLNSGVSGYTTGSAFDGAGNFYVTNFSSNSVSLFNNSGVLQGTFGGGYSTPEAILFNRAGSAFVGNVGATGIRQFNAAGTLLQTFAAGRVDWMDLAADQRTMYFTAEGTTIQRYDLVTQTILTPFATGLGGDAFALRILRNGGVLVATDVGVLQMSSTGSIVRTYTAGSVGAFFALNLDPDGTSFWTGSVGNGSLYEFNIASGALERTINTGSGSFYGVSVFGEITQGGPPPTTAPEPGTVALLGAGLLATGAAAARRRRLTT